MQIALTFDDGPNDPYTLDLLAVLAKHDVKATFFMVGKWVLERPDIAKRVATAGHWIGNHTMNHFKLTELITREVPKEIENCRELLTMAVGEHSNMFRPPFMLISPWIEKLAEDDFGLKTIRFHAAAGDGGEPRGVDFMFDKIVRGLNGKSGIILMHDGSHERMGAVRTDTVMLVDRLISQYKNEGAEFVVPLEL